MEVELPDGTVLPLPDDATGADAAAAIGPGLARAALAVKVDGEPRDLARALIDDAATENGHRPRLEILTERSGAEALALIRHDVAHVLAAAMLELYPGVKISIGPAIDNGFYYDFQFPEGVVVNESDFPAIEAAMQRHIDADELFAREDVTTAQALERFRGEDQPYKVELITDLIANESVSTVSLYTNGPFTDLCRGPHAPSTKRIKAFALQSVAVPYTRVSIWREASPRQ
jgi:threonyl-tRNA synthetase